MTQEMEDLRPADAPASLYGPDGSVRVFQDPAMDRFVGVLLNVASELWVLREQIANIRDLMDRKGLVTEADLGALLNDQAMDEKRDADAQEFVHRLLAPLREPVA